MSKIFFPSRDIFSIYLKMNKYAKQILDLVKSAIFNVTIEPCFFLFAMNYGFYIVVSRTLYINKVGKRRIKKLFHCLNIDESRNENSSIIHFFYRFVQLTWTFQRLSVMKYKITKISKLRFKSMLLSWARTTKSFKVLRNFP